jgi:pimeloyl-ACP methyl ester carboxylesterase
VLAVGLAPLVNLVKAAHDGAGGRAVQFFLGGEAEEVPDRYRDATPSRDPTVALLIVRGEEDVIVPRAWTVVSPEHRAALVEVAATDHFDVIDPRQPAWEVVIAELDAALGR